MEADAELSSAWIQNQGLRRSERQMAQNSGFQYGPQLRRSERLQKTGTLLTEVSSSSSTALVDLSDAMDSKISSPAYRARIRRTLRSGRNKRKGVLSTKQYNRLWCLYVKSLIADSKKYFGSRRRLRLLKGIPAKSISKTMTVINVVLIF